MQDAYNGLGQLITEYQSHAGAVNTSTTPKVQYGYSFVSTGGGPNHSRLVSMTYPNGRLLNYNYNSGVDDRISRLSSLSESAGTLESYSYLGLDTVVKRSQMYHGAAVVTLSEVISGGNPDGGDQYTGLDRFGRVVEQRWANGSSAVTDDFLYSYDQYSNVLSRSNALNSSFTEQYGYDNLNRLTSFTRGSTTESWGLDALGNWTSFTTNGSTQTRSFNNQNQITAISGTPSTPSYDKNGNTTRDQLNQTYTYDAWNRLVKVVAGTNTEVYTYDALGRRITTKLNNNSATDLYFSSAWQVLEEDVGGTMQNQYVWSPVYVDALVEGDLSGTRYYVQQDANGNVTAIVSTAGSVQERFVYDPYGQPSYYTAAWGSTSNTGWVYQFQGGRYDSTSGLYNFRNRDLSPTLGRWMEQDPLGYAAGDDNLYEYDDSAPIANVDPSGLDGFHWSLLTGPFGLVYWAGDWAYEGIYRNWTINDQIAAAKQARADQEDIIQKTMQAPTLGGVQGRENTIQPGLSNYLENTQTAAKIGATFIVFWNGNAFAWTSPVGQTFLYRGGGKWVNECTGARATAAEETAANRTLIAQFNPKNGPLHHIATNKNWVSTLRGGPWSPRFESIFKKAGLTLEDAANKVIIPGHIGPHPEAYHQLIFDMLSNATEGLSGQYKDALLAQLELISYEAQTAGTVLNNLLIGR